MDILYELWLQSVCGFEPDKVEKAFVLFEGKGQKFSSGESDRQKLKKAGLAENIEEKFSDPEYFKAAQAIAEYCKKNEIRIINQESEEYPDSLRHIDIPPRVLFVKGEKLDFNKKPAVSVVGCRKPTPQGKYMAKQLGKNLAENGIVVVSGMAEGIDGEAHRGAVEAGGKTVAVLAGSVDAIYPRSNERLYYEILKNGSIISERPPGTVVKKYFYQQRNRIVVGLSLGTVVVEGKEKSGTSITARLALDNNRDIFAVPGSPLVWQSELPNRLIGEGAEIVHNVDVPAMYYKNCRPELFQSVEVSKDQNIQTPVLTGDDRVIVEYIKENGGIADMEEMAENLKISPSVLGSKLTVLCIRGILSQESGNRYMIVGF